MHAVRTALAVGLLLSVALAGCAGATTPGSTSSPPPTAAPPTQVPGGIASPSAPADGSVVDPGGGGGSGGSDPGNPGGGGGGGDFVVPNPGRTINPRQVAIESLAVTVDGRNVSVVATWTSGVAPCYVLDTVAVKQDGNEFTVSITEGAGEADAVCIEIAMTKSTLIRLGDLAPGDYVVAAQGETAPAQTFTVG